MNSDKKIREFVRNILKEVYDGPTEYKKPYRFYLLCDKLCDLEGVEVKNKMIADASPISRKTFVDNCAYANELFKYEGQMADDPSHGFYKSTVKGTPCLYMQYAGFEFIFLKDYQGGKEYWLEDLNESNINEHYDLDEDSVGELANMIKTKLGFKELNLLGSGNNGFAFSVGNGKVMKITTDLSEYTEAIKIKGKKNKHIANVYEVYRLAGDYNNLVVIIMELLKVDNNELEGLEIDLNSAFNQAGLGYYGTFGHDYLISNDININNAKRKVLPLLNGETKIHTSQFFDLLEEMKRLGMTSSDFSAFNLGYKDDGSLAYLDLEYGIDTTDNFEHTLSLNEGPIWNQGGILLIKGSPIEGGSQRLFATSVKNLIEIKPGKKGTIGPLGSPGTPAANAVKMAVLGDDFFRLKYDDKGELRAFRVAWRSEPSLAKMLNFKNHKLSIVLNNKKTPFHWESLQYNNIGVMLNKIGSQILRADNVNFFN